MKIVLIGPVFPYRGGIAHFTFQLAKALQGAGHELSLISYTKQYPKWLYPGKDDKDLSQGRQFEGAEYLLSPLNPLDWQKTLKRVKAIKPDLVVMQYWTSFWAPATAWLLGALRKAGIDVRLLVHNASSHESGWLDRVLSRMALGKAEHFLVMNPKEAEKVKALQSSPKIRQVPHPIYPPFAPSGKSKKELREALGLDPDKRVGLFFGFVRPYKGLHTLLDAIRLLRDEGKLEAMQFLIAGEFWEDKAEYLGKIEEGGLGQNLRVVDAYIPDEKAGGFFEAADFFVAPYTGGTQSGVLKTALGYGLPCIVSAAIAEPGVDGGERDQLVFRTNDVKDLAAKLSQAAELHPSSQAETTGRIEESWQKLAAALTGLG